MSPTPALATERAERAPCPEAIAAVKPVGVVTAWLSEAACWPVADGAMPVLTFASGASAERARIGVERLLTHGVRGLVSFGFAAGLAPAARPGCVVIADVIAVPSGGAIPTDAAWRGALLRRLGTGGPRALVARIAGADRLPVAIAEKRAAFTSLIAAASDTESHVVAQLAHAVGLPFLAVRVVADAAEEMRPAAAMAALGTDGEARPVSLAAQLALRPWEIAASWRFVQSVKAGLVVLRQLAVLMPPPEAV